MIHRWKVGLLGLLVILLPALGATARTLSTYFNCLPGSVTALVLTNASSYDSEDAFTVTMYDAEGGLLETITRGLGPYESTVLFLNDFIEEAGELSWGSLNIEARVLLQAGLWLGTEEAWVSVTNVQAQTLSTEGLDIRYYWYGVNYANTQNRRTGVSIINPSEESVSGTAYVYDSAGQLQNFSDFTLGPHRSAYFQPESVVPSGQDQWGLIDIRSTLPLVVASEYFDGNGVLVDVDLVDSVYYLQVSQPEGGDS